MRSPVGELVAGVRSLVVRSPQNQAAVPYVAGRIDTRGSLSGDLGTTQGGAIEAFGQNGTLFAIITKLAQGTASS